LQAEHPGFLLGLFLDLKMEATCSFTTPVDFQRTTPLYISEYRTLRNHRCENLKSNIVSALVRQRSPQSCDSSLEAYTCVVSEMLECCSTLTRLISRESPIESVLFASSVRVSSNDVNAPSKSQHISSCCSCLPLLQQELTRIS
jgi:hypothetical protein